MFTHTSATDIGYHDCDLITIGKISVKITEKKLSEIQLNPENLNKGTKRGEELLKMSIEKFGFRSPGILDKNGVAVAGEHRKKAAEDLGIEDAIILQASEEDLGKSFFIQFDDLDLSNPTDSSHEIAHLDNFIGSKVNIDLKRAAELQERGAINLNGVYNQRELRRAGIEPKIDISAKREKSRQELEENWGKWNTDGGHVWKLGNHRLGCGDTSDIDFMNLVMSGKKADMIFTDPPYNVASENKLVYQDLSVSAADLKQSDWDHNFDIRPSLD